MRRRASAGWIAPCGGAWVADAIRAGDHGDVLPAAHRIGDGGGAAAGQDATLPEGEGKKILERACVSCHGLDQVTSSSLDKDAWKSIAEEMRGYGSPVNDDETPVLIDYLVKNFGPKK